MFVFRSESVFFQHIVIQILLQEGSMIFGQVLVPRSRLGQSSIKNLSSNVFCGDVFRTMMNMGRGMKLRSPNVFCVDR